MPPAVPRLKFNCLVCHKEFERRAAEIARPAHPPHYCSIKCRGIGMRNQIILTCLECHKEFERPKAEAARHGKDGHWCSWKCWKIWQRKKCKSYPKIGQRHIHRVVMEKKLGRKLTSKDIVHHEDENKKNFKSSNLILTDRSGHAKIHFSKRRKCKNSSSGNTEPRK
jgi:HNH endonuclease